MTATALLEDESMVKLLLQEREGGETEVETPVGFVDLVTDDYIIELKHVKSWKDGTKVLLFTEYLGDRKPRNPEFTSSAATPKISKPWSKPLSPNLASPLPGNAIPFSQKERSFVLPAVLGG
jgi:hypothetical protein